MEIETRRLLLRPLREDDAHAMALGVNNFNVSRNLARVKFPYSVAEAAAFIQIQRKFDPRSVVCAVTFRCAPDELIGVVAYEYGEGGEPEFGYWLRECCWNMRIMSQAASALLHHAFAHGGVETLLSSFHSDNPNSGRILNHLGFAETHSELNFSLAQNREVPTTKLRLTREVWLAQQNTRAA